MAVLRWWAVVRVLLAGSSSVRPADPLVPVSCALLLSRLGFLGRLVSPHVLLKLGVAHKAPRASVGAQGVRGV